MDNTGLRRQTPTTGWPAEFADPVQFWVACGRIVPGQFPVLGQQMADFVKTRMTRNTQAMQAFSACRSVPEALQVQMAWFRDAVEDYIAEISKLSHLYTNVFAGSEGQVDGRIASASPASVKTKSSP